MKSLVFGPLVSGIPLPAVVFSDEPPEKRDHVLHVCTKNEGQTMHFVRQIWHEQHQIAYLAGTQVYVTDENQRALAEKVVRKLGDFANELGNSAVDSFQGVESMAHNLHNHPNASTSDDLYKLYKNKPAIVIAAGPSASQHLADIAKIQHGAVIFAVDVMTQACLDAGILPDWITTLERPPLAGEVNRPPEGMGVICPLSAQYTGVERYDRHCWWLNGDLHTQWAYGDDYRPVNSGPSCGTLGVAAAVHAGCGPIYLVGHDLAFGDDGASHAGDANELAAAGQAQSSHPIHDHITVDGVKTTKGWAWFAQSITDLIGGADVIKVGGGLPIVGTKPGALPDTVSDCDKGATLPVRHPPRADVRDDMRKAAHDLREGGIRARKAAIYSDAPAIDMVASRLFASRSKHLIEYLLTPTYNLAHLRAGRGDDVDTITYRLARSIVLSAPVLARALEDLADELR